MPAVERHAPGMFCWAELATTDQNAAKHFYSELFGWTANDLPFAPGQVYTLAMLGGREAGAIYSLDEAQRSRGVPSHWNAYFAVADADKAAARAKELGATVLAGPFDVMTAGRMAVINDPGQANFCVWQAGDHIGAKVAMEPGAPCWVELATRNAANAKAFYTALFGWTAKDSSADSPMPYTEWQLNGASFGGMMEMDAGWGDVPPHWLIYFLVADCDASAAKARQLGAKFFCEPRDIPGVGRFAIVQDLQGAAFSIFQPARPA